jgi:hypothetical protein
MLICFGWYFQDGEKSKAVSFCKKSSDLFAFQCTEDDVPFWANIGQVCLHISSPVRWEERGYT